ncbi:MAG: DUF4038 domain-containing protein [Acidobacteriota bacterium]|nr:DUF4038 domain-containing protein [Acidobacteriota bacterium]
MLSRRAFCGASATSLWLFSRAAEAQDRFGVQNCAAEWSYHSGKSYGDPFNEVELDVIFATPSGEEHRVPGFWAGGSAWHVRYAPPAAGHYSYRTVCSDVSNADLHNRTGKFSATPYAGTNPLYQHGPLRVAQDKRHLEHADGTPFFWLGDTWWMGLCKRLTWPDGFQTLTVDRSRKGFSVVQIVAGLYPDMEPYDARGANEAGFPWERDYARINPSYFDEADVRIQHLADHGLVSCVVAAWGYFLPQMGMRKMKQHWRYLVARWGAYPTVWCLAGEGTMPFYLSKTKEQDAEIQKRGWTEIARYVKATDPLRHPITIHPSRSSRETVDDPSVLDFDMLQTGHDDRRSVPNTIESVKHSLESSPKMPVLVGEVCYEGIQEASRQEVQRFMFWSCILSGAGGHTYGANGIWQVNTLEKPYGLSPHGHSWGGPPWEAASQLPGSGQLGLGKSLLTRYSWWRLEPRPDMVDPHWNKENYWSPFAAHIPGEAVIAFAPTAWKALVIRDLEAGPYRAFLFNPSDGTEQALGTIQPDAAGTWQAPEFPIFRDWVLVLDRKNLG